MVQINPLVRRTAALKTTDFASVLAVASAGDTIPEKTRRAFFEGLLKNTVGEKDLNDYKAALAKLNALKPGEKPEGGYKQISDALTRASAIYIKCVDALKPFTESYRSGPDVWTDYKHLSNEGVTEAEGASVDAVIKASGMTREQLAQAFKTPINFDDFVSSQLQADPLLSTDSAYRLMKEFYPDAYYERS